MKRIIAAAMAALCVGALASCGTANDDGFSKSDAPEITPTTAAETATEAEDVTEAHTEEMTQTFVAVDGDASQEVTDVFQAVLRAKSNKDTAGLLKCIVPDKLAGYMLSYEQPDYDELGELGDILPDNKFEICGEQAADEDTLKLFRNGYSVFTNAYRALTENGITAEIYESGELSGVQLEVLDGCMESFALLDDLPTLLTLDCEPLVDITEVKIVTIQTGDVTRNIIMYNVAGEGWKVDRIIRMTAGDVREGSGDLDTMAALSLAKNIYISIMSSAVDLDEQGLDVGGACLFGSPGFGTVAGADSPVADILPEMRTTMGMYADPGSDYIALIVDGVCVFAAAEYKGRLGIYPTNRLPDSLEAPIALHEVDPEDYTLSSVYEYAEKLINNRR